MPNLKKNVLPLSGPTEDVTSSVPVYRKKFLIFVQFSSVREWMVVDTLNETLLFAKTGRF